MKSLAIRVLAMLVMGGLALMVLSGATAPAKSGAVLQPDKVVIVSTEDVKGKTSPCG